MCTQNNKKIICNSPSSTFILQLMITSYKLPLDSHGKLMLAP
jgi:hypothetical protein